MEEALAPPLGSHGGPLFLLSFKFNDRPQFVGREPSLKYDLAAIPLRAISNVIPINVAFGLAENCACGLLVHNGPVIVC